MAETTAALPIKQRAILTRDESGSLYVADDVPIVPLDPDAVIVKTEAVALNPVDTKMAQGFLEPGCVLGFDFAGTIAAIGSEVPKSRGLQLGDRVCGSADGVDARRPLAGAFAEYTTCPATFVVKIHPDMAFESAAAMGTALTSAGLALFRSLQLPGTLEAPAAEPQWVLVYGGATSTGTMMIQLLRRAGHRPITTCSPANFDMVASYGAEKAFDYHSANCAEEIRLYTQNSLAYAVDCVTVSSSTKACYGSIGRAGGRYVSLDPYEDSLITRKVVKPDWILATTITGRGSSWPEPWGRDGDAELKAWGESYFAGVERIIATGADELKPHPISIRKGNFEGILNGIDEIRRKEVRGFKLVYPLRW